MRNPLRNSWRLQVNSSAIQNHAGRAMQVRWKYFACAAMLAFSVNVCTAAEWTIDQLMSGLSQVKTANASFMEIKYMALLDAPIESSGELMYVAPDRLEKRTIKPRYEVMKLEGDTLKLERGTRKFTLQLTEAPELAALIESMRATLAGDRKALERTFTAKLDGTRERWSLMLMPKNARALQLIRNIRLAGSKSEILEIEVLQSDGDRTITAMTPIKKSRP